MTVFITDFLSGTMGWIIKNNNGTNGPPLYCKKYVMLS